MHLRRLPIRPKELFRQQERWMSVVQLSDSDAVDKFRTINEQSVMYFTATWCPPCKMISPVYEELSKKYPKVAFGKIDVDDNQDSAMEFQISAVPTFVFSKGATVTNKFSGADKNQLEKFVQDLDG
jgi:thioredoxin